MYFELSGFIFYNAGLLYFSDIINTCAYRKEYKIIEAVLIFLPSLIIIKDVKSMYSNMYKDQFRLDIMRRNKEINVLTVSYIFVKQEEVRISS